MSSIESEYQVYLNIYKPGVSVDGRQPGSPMTFPEFQEFARQFYAQQAQQAQQLVQQQAKQLNSQAVFSLIGGLISIAFGIYLLWMLSSL